MQLKDRIIVVTGAASGIGRAMARRFHNEDAKGSLKNNFTFSHLSFKPSSAADQSRNPRNSPLFLWVHSIAATKSDLNLSANSANLFFE